MIRKLFATAAFAALAGTLNFSAAQAADPNRGGTLTASIDHQPRTLDPVKGDAATGDRRVFNAIFEPLLRVAKNGQLEPVLAQSWDVSPDGKAITFKLRPGVTFHDGTPFDAKAVAANIARVLDPKTNSSRIQDVRNIASVDVIDGMTVRFNLHAASATTLPFLGSEGGYMVSPAAVAKHGEDFGRNPVGTGPFAFVDWPGGERLNLVRNKNYWRKDEKGAELPYLDNLVIRTIRQSSVSVLELQSGTVQLAINVPIREAEKLASAGKHTIVETPYMAQLMGMINVKRPPLDNKLVRQALAHAFDRPQLAKVAGLSYGKTVPTLVTEQDSVYDASIQGAKYDPAKAKSLLSQAGVENLTIKLSVIQREPDTQIAQVMQAQARASGINLVLDVGDRQTIVDKMSKTHTHEMAVGRVGIPALDVDQIFTFYFSKEAPQNYSLQNDAAVHDLVKRGSEEIDNEKRRAIYTELQKKLLDESYFLFLAAYPFLGVADNRVQGLETDKVGVWLFDKIWLK